MRPSLVNYNVIIVKGVGRQAVSFFLRVHSVFSLHSTTINCTVLCTIMAEQVEITVEPVIISITP